MPNKAAMRAWITDLLTHHLPAQYVYHNLQHTLHVCEKALDIGRAEGCTDHELDLLEAAALFHDTGFTVSDREHELEGCRIARKQLPGFGYAESDIDIIESMIMATRLPQQPGTLLECVLADADLEYLGTEQAMDIAAELHRELKYKNPALSFREWNDYQIAFLIKHHYFTRFCIAHRDPGKQEYLQRLLNGVE